MQKFCILVNDKFSHNDLVSWMDAKILHLGTCKSQFSHNDLVSLPISRMDATILHLGKMTNSVTVFISLAKPRMDAKILHLR